METATTATRTPPQPQARKTSKLKPYFSFAGMKRCMCGSSVGLYDWRTQTGFYAVKEGTRPQMCDSRIWSGALFFRVICGTHKEIAMFCYIFPVPFLTCIYFAPNFPALCGQEHAFPSLSSGNPAEQLLIAAARLLMSLLLRPTAKAFLSEQTMNARLNIEYSDKGPITTSMESDSHGPGHRKNTPT